MSTRKKGPLPMLPESPSTASPPQVRVCLEREWRSMRGARRRLDAWIVQAGRLRGRGGGTTEEIHRLGELGRQLGREAGEEVALSWGDTMACLQGRLHEEGRGLVGEPIGLEGRIRGKRVRERDEERSDCKTSPFRRREADRETVHECISSRKGLLRE